MSAQLSFDFDKNTCKFCQHTGASMRFCFMRYGKNGDFEHTTPDSWCKDFYSIELPRFDNKTQKV